MKKLLLILVLSVSVATVSAQSYRETGVKTTIEAAINPFSCTVEPFFAYGTNLTASFGYQFNPYLFLGASTGLSAFEELLLPIMVDFRYYVLDRKNTPFIGMRVGKGYVLDAKYCSDSLMSMAQLGYAFGDLTVSLYATSKTYFLDNNVDIRLVYTRIIQVGIGWTF